MSEHCDGVVSYPAGWIAPAAADPRLLHREIVVVAVCSVLLMIHKMKCVEGFPSASVFVMRKLRRSSAEPYAGMCVVAGATFERQSVKAVRLQRPLRPSRE